MRLLEFCKALAVNHELDLVAALARHEITSAESWRPGLQKVFENVQLVPLPNTNRARRVAHKSVFWLRHLAAGIIDAEYYYDSGAFADAVDEAVRSGNYDVIFTQYWFTARSQLRRCEIPVVCDSHDVFREKLEREAAQAPRASFRRLVLERQLRHVMTAESAALNGMTRVIAVHEKDAAMLRTKCGVRVPIDSIPTITRSSPPPAGVNAHGTHRMLFFGALHSPMNQDGIRRAVQEILPRVRSLVPDARLIVRGTGADPALQALLRTEGVDYEGTVEDLEQAYAGVDCLVLPLALGSGLKGRVLEAMAAGVPVVGTSIAAEGIPVEGDTSMLVREDADAISQAVAQIMTDRVFAARLAQQAMRFHENTYNAEVLCAAVERTLTDAANTSETHSQK